MSFPPSSFFLFSPLTPVKTDPLVASKQTRFLWEPISKDERRQSDREVRLVDLKEVVSCFVLPQDDPAHKHVDRQT